MKLHANARKAPKSRLELVERIQSGWSATVAAEAAGGSLRTGLMWWSRSCLEGANGLQDRSSAPHRIPHKPPSKLVDRIRGLRLRRLAARQIGRLLGLARSTVSAVLVGRDT